MTMRLSANKLLEISFGKALFLSVLWHFFWISSITVVNFPDKVHYPRFADISFMGTLLDEPSFEVHVTQGSTTRSAPVFFQKRITQFSVRQFPREHFLKTSLPSTEELWGEPGEFFGLKKKNPSLLGPRETSSKDKTPHLEGPAAERVLYYQPEMPPLPKWVDASEIDSDLKVRFWISPRGEVVNVEKLISSGNATLDLIGMRYLRGWRFNLKSTNEVEWGMVTLHFFPETNE